MIFAIEMVSACDVQMCFWLSALMIRSPRFGRADSWAMVGDRERSLHLLRQSVLACGIGGHDTAGLPDSQAALSLVDVFSWVSRRDDFLELQRGTASSHLVACVFVRSFVRSFTYCCLGSVVVTMRPVRLMETPFDLPFFFSSRHFVLSPFVCFLGLLSHARCMLVAMTGRHLLPSMQGPRVV